MSTAHYGRAVPMALRKFKVIETTPYIPSKVSGFEEGGGTLSFHRLRSFVHEESNKKAFIKGTERGGSSSSSTSGDSNPTSVENSNPSFLCDLIHSLKNPFEGLRHAIKMHKTKREVLKPIILPRDLPEGIHLVVFLTRLKHIKHVDSWFSVRQGLDGYLRKQKNLAKSRLDKKIEQELEEIKLKRDELLDKRRREDMMNAENHTKDENSFQNPQHAMVGPNDQSILSNDQSIPESILSNDQSIHIHRSTASKKLAENELRIENPYKHTDSEMNVYICALLPIFPPLRLIWRLSLRRWYKTIVEVGQKNVNANNNVNNNVNTKNTNDNTIPLTTSLPPPPSLDISKIELCHALTWKEKYLQDLGVINDGRAYGLLVKNSGEILWCSDEEFKEEESEEWVMKVVREDLIDRENQATKFIEERKNQIQRLALEM